MNTKNKNHDDPEKIKQIKEWISNGEIDTITIDTTVFDDAGMRLDRGPFSLLKQFGRHPTTLVISEVVLKEIKKHLRERLGKVKARLARDMNDALELIGGSREDFYEIKKKIKELPDAVTLCEMQTDLFVSEAKAEIIEANPHVKMSDLIDLYFNQRPPFQKGNPKKSEFPDAISLSSLEAWAVKNDKKIVVVSRDGDWKSFCEQSLHLHIIKDLSTALALFQTPDEVVQEVMRRLTEELTKNNSLLKMMILKTLSGNDWYGDASIMAGCHRFHFDVEDVELLEISRFNLNEEAGINLVGIDYENVSVTCEFSVSARFAVEFLFNSWLEDSEEYAEAGRARIEESSDFKVSVFLTTPIKHGDLEHFETETRVEELTLGFGFIEPNELSDRE
ncbi:PIN domain-containing protein [Herbaspirillum aquaticum]|uniref:DUF4935 domain-containing protein n=1 Tax=Herbaspirillum aquaticum TaxID=568783 RepID=A0A225SMB4_9BURK|nr:PIN domain-containing protein [Herbaspirillum aquaticum]OWY31680.1 hypothetical protein CEJ45_24330 [Herbaspirillum aquaticum]